MKRKGISMILCGALLLGTLAGCGDVQSETPVDKVKKGGFSVDASVHDPSIIVGEDGEYYIFGSHMDAAKSEDLRQWKSFASGVNEENPLFSDLFGGDLDAFSFVGKNDEGGYSVWAPDVIYNEAMGKYVMYFCTTSTYKKSSLGFAVSDNIEGPYSYVDMFLHSGFDRKTVKDINFYDYVPETEIRNYLGSDGYDNLNWPNCIDPTVFYDRDGKMWMTYGSWSGGMFLLEIDEETGYPIHPEADPEKEVDAYYGKKLIGGGHNSIEGPYILYDEVSDYYYLFVSYGSLQANGGYQIRLFRSENVDGPYVGADGENLGMVVDHSTYGVKMMGNYTFPSLTYTYMAPGHNSAFTDKDGKMYVVYHQRFKNMGELHNPRVHQLFRTENGWLAAAPFATDGETLKEDGYKESEILGTYYLVNHGTDIGKKVHECEKIKLEKGGNITGAQKGTFSLKEGTSYITLTIGEQEYQGVMIQMNDEAGNDTMCFTAVGNNNESIWGVHYR